MSSRQQRILSEGRSKPHKGLAKTVGQMVGGGMLAAVIIVFLYILYVAIAVGVPTLVILLILHLAGVI